MTVPTTVPGTRVTGLRRPLSRLVLGTMNFGDTVDAQAAELMLDAALDAGITAVDTANAYAGGVTEAILGALLPGRRDRIVLATKAGMQHPDAGDNPLLSPAALRAGLDGSLGRLRIDHVDLFYLHQPDRDTPVADSLAAVKDFIDQGKVSAYGVSNHAAWQISEINHTADGLGMPRPVVGQNLYNLLARRIEDEYLEFARTTGLLTMVYNPLAGGLLTGRYSFTNKPTEGRFGDSRLAAMYTERYWDERTFTAITALSAIAGDAGIGLVELSLRWLLSKPGVGAVLLGGSKLAQLQANIAAAAAGPLPEDVVVACDRVGAQLRGPMPAYNR
jgi:aryl-alcohol dehydrogenase-like predicted oxidoreductase